MTESPIDEAELRAVAVLATATMHVVGRDAPVVASLRQLLRHRTRAAYDNAIEVFDRLDPGVRERIGWTAPSIARRKLKGPNLPGLLGVLRRG